MGFKCPICSEDFGKDKNKWKHHINTEHYGAGEDVVKYVKDAAEGQPINTDNINNDDLQ